MGLCLFNSSQAAPQGLDDADSRAHAAITELPHLVEQAAHNLLTSGGRALRRFK